MSLDIVMPRLSDTMESGIVGRWLRSDGDFVAEGEPIVEIETDKTTIELVAERSGYVRLLVTEGRSVPTGSALARIVASADEGNGELNADLGTPQSEPAPKVRTHRVDSPATPERVERTRATPVARKLARQAGIDLDLVTNRSGPDARIQKIDIERLLAERSAAPRGTGSSPGGDRVIELTRIQMLTAERVTQSKQQVPHYYVSLDADAGQALALKTAAHAKHGTRLSLTDVVAFACAGALRAHPSVNASWINERIVQRAGVHLGIAVALDSSELVVPVIHDADTMTLAQLSAARRSLTARARERKLHPRELEGGTFTISNLGAYGVVEFHAIVNPPESGILAVGATEDRVVVRDGQALIRPIMTLSLSADHRVYSGAAAAEFMQSVRLGIEQPAIALLDEPVRPPADPSSERADPDSRR